MPNPPTREERDPFLDDLHQQMARDRAGARRMRFVLGGLVIIAAAGLAWFRWGELVRYALEDVAPYEEARHRKGMLKLMRRTLPGYVVAVGSGDDKERATATRKFLDRCGVHAGIRPRCEAMVAAVGEAAEWMVTSRTQPEETLREHLDRVERSITLMNERLRAIGAPFLLDSDSGAVRDGQRWKLRFLVTTSEVLSTWRFHAGDRELDVQRVRRLDSLNVVDLVHGKAREGRAVVLDEDARQLVHGRWMPSLGTDGVLRDLNGKEEAAGYDEQVRAALVELVPADLRPHLEAIGEHARQRRALMERAESELSRRDVHLVEPRDYFYSRRWLRSLRNSLGRGHQDLADAMKDYSVDSPLPPEERERITKVENAILDAYLRGVARHEAWHLLVPEPADTAEVPAQVGRELVAYLGALADAEGEAALELDHAARLFHRARGKPPSSATDAAVTTMFMLIGKEAGPPSAEARPADVVRERQAAARRILQRVYNEQRTMQLLGGSTAASDEDDSTADAEDAPEGE